MLLNIFYRNSQKKCNNIYKKDFVTIHKEMKKKLIGTSLDTCTCIIQKKIVRISEVEM